MSEFKVGCGGLKVQPFLRWFSLFLMTGLMISCIVFQAGCRKASRSTKRGRIQGTVITYDGKPCPQARIFVDGSGFFAIANQKGKYTLARVPPGTYAIGCIKPGYIRAAKLHVVVGGGKATKNINFTLKRDPAYIPDSIRIISATPTPQTRLDDGQRVELKCDIEYTLNNAVRGEVNVRVLDDQNRDLMRGRHRHFARAGTHRFPFRHRLMTPSKLTGTINVNVLLTTIGSTSVTVAQDFISYYVGVPRDQLMFVGLEPPASTIFRSGETVEITPLVSCRLASLDEAVLRIEVLGAQPLSRFSIPIRGVETGVKKTDDETTNRRLSISFVTPPECTAVKLRAQIFELADKDKAKPITTAWSATYLIR